MREKNRERRGGGRRGATGATVHSTMQTNYDNAEVVKLKQKPNYQSFAISILCFFRSIVHPDLRELKWLPDAQIEMHFKCIQNIFSFNL